MKFRLIMALVVSGFVANINAADINCNGSVDRVMDYPVYCNGNSAFKTSSSNGKWICSTSKNGSAMVLSALAAGKTLEVYVDSQNGAYTCATIPHYTAAKYIIINP